VDTRYEILAQVMGSARAGGMKRMGFITRPGEPLPGTGSPVPANGQTSTSP